MKRFLVACIFLLCLFAFTACELQGDSVETAAETIPILEWITDEDDNPQQVRFSVRSEGNAEYTPNNVDLHPLLLRCGFVLKEDDRELAVEEPFTLYFAQAEQTVRFSTSGAEWAGHLYLPQGIQAFEQLLQQLPRSPGSVRTLSDHGVLPPVAKVKSIKLASGQVATTSRNPISSIEVVLQMLGDIPARTADTAELKDGGTLTIDLYDNTWYTVSFSAKGDYAQIKCGDRLLGTFEIYPNVTAKEKKPVYYSPIYRQILKAHQWATASLRMDLVDQYDDNQCRLYAFEVDGYAVEQSIDYGQRAMKYFSEGDLAEFVLKFRQDWDPESVQVLLYSSWDDYAPDKAVELEYGETLQLPTDRGHYVLDITARYEAGYTRYYYIYAVEYREQTVPVDEKYIRLAKEVFEPRYNGPPVPACQEIFPISTGDGEAQVMVFDAYPADWGASLAVVVETGNGAYARYIGAFGSYDTICADMDGDGAEELVIHYKLPDYDGLGHGYYSTVILGIGDDGWEELFVSGSGYIDPQSFFDSGFTLSPLDSQLVAVDNVHTGYRTVVAGREEWCSETDEGWTGGPEIYDLEGEVWPEHRGKTYANHSQGNFLTVSLQDVDGDGVAEVVTAEPVQMLYRSEDILGYGFNIMKYDAATGGMSVIRSSFLPHSGSFPQAGNDAQKKFLSQSIDRWCREQE